MRGQLWEGSPVEYVRDITPGEVEEMAQKVRRNLGHLQDHEASCYPLGQEYAMLHVEAQGAVAAGK